MDNESKYRLKQLKINTIGIVSKPAVDAFEDGNTILLKSDQKGESTMTDNQEQESDVLDPEIEAEAETQEPEISDSFLRRVAGALANIGKSTGNSEPDQDSSQDTDSADETGILVATLKATQAAHLESMAKQYETQLESAIEKLSTQYESKVAELSERVESAESFAKAEGSKAEKAEWIAKSNSLTTLAVSPVEIAQNLQELSKSASTEQVDWVFNVLKAADNMLKAANVWGEFGNSLTSNEPSSLIGKASEVAKADDVPLADALLDMPAHEQAAHIAKRRGGVS